MSNMAGVLLLEAETAYPSRAHGFLLGDVLLIFFVCVSLSTVLDPLFDIFFVCSSLYSF
jgi:hypothetical protein